MSSNQCLPGEEENTKNWQITCKIHILWCSWQATCWRISC